jgi:hypothetical protein
MKTAIKERGILSPRGMGGFLNPPGHPEHTHHITIGLRNMPCNRGELSLSAAIDCDWLDDGARRMAKAELDKWEANKLPLADAKIQDWIKQVLGYFKGCYKGEGAEPICWHCDKLHILKDGDNARPIEDHAGVHMIRKYYPEYVPSGNDFAGAYRGTKG